MTQVPAWHSFSSQLMYGIAKRVAPDASQLWDDMVQEGWLRLLTVKQEPTINADAYYRSVVHFGMVDMLRKERKGAPVISFARAKRLRLLRCPSCFSRNTAWTIYWPSLVRCRDCVELFAIEESGTE